MGWNVDATTRGVASGNGGQGWNPAPTTLFSTVEDIQPAGRRGRRPLRSIIQPLASIAAQPRQNRTQRQSLVHGRSVMPRWDTMAVDGVACTWPAQQKRLSFGAPPRFFGQDQRNGVERGRNHPGGANSSARAGGDARPYSVVCNGRENPTRGASGTPPPTKHPSTRLQRCSGAQTAAQGRAGTPAPTARMATRVQAEKNSNGPPLIWGGPWSVYGGN